MSAVPSAPTFSWKPAFAAIVLVELALIALYFETAQAMVGIWWRSETFNHAFLVPPIALWLIWERRHVLGHLAPRPALWLLLPLAAIAFVWLLGELAAVNSVTQFALVALMVCAVPLIIGPSTAKRIAFPLFFLFFAVPIGEFVMPKLMDWTAMFTVMGLRASGIPVYQEGLHFVIPSGRWSVVEACSGVRYLIASIVVGTLFAYLNYQSLKRRLIFVGVSILVPLAANWVRAYLIVMIGHFSGNQLAAGADHLIYGWLFFGVVMMIMFAIGLRWREHEPAMSAIGNSDDAMLVSHSGGLLTAAVLALGVAIVPRAAVTMLDSGPELPPPMLSVQSLEQDGWNIVDGQVSDWRPAYANPSGTLNTVLAKADRRVSVFIAYYRQQNFERKLISSENVLVKSNDRIWAQVERGNRQTSLAGQAARVRTGLLRETVAGLGTDPRRLRVWHWYWIDGRIVTSDHLGKLWLALARLSGRGDESAAVFIYALEPDGDAALDDYVSTAGVGIARLLEQTATQRR